MKYIFLQIFLLISASSIAQQISYKEWQDEAKNEINLMPEYGHVIKSAAQLKEDSVFIITVLKQDTTRRKGSEHLVRLGFKYLGDGDIKTAMRRFNQAWLLDATNENAYWGFGSIYATFNDYPKAIAEYDKGLVINPLSQFILTDKATIYFVSFQQDHNQDNLEKALTLLKKSFEINSQNLNTVYKLSVCYFLANDCVDASKFYNKFIMLGGPARSDGFAGALKKLCDK